MKVIIAGSRSIKDYGYVEEAAEKSGWDITEIVSGTAAGVDKLGERLGREYDIPVKRFPADWDNIEAPGAVIRTNHRGAYNVRAGIDRNAKMGRYADAAIIVWDGVSPGSRHMINFMKSQGKPVFVYNLKII